MAGVAEPPSASINLAMFGHPEKGSRALAALQNVQEWTRVRFKLAADAPVLVSEIACALPGCPPLETVVAFWTADDKRHQFKLYKPMREVVYDDIGWMMGSPAAHDGIGWDCC